MRGEYLDPDGKDPDELAAQEIARIIRAGGTPSTQLRARGDSLGRVRSSSSSGERGSRSPSRGLTPVRPPKGSDG